MRCMMLSCALADRRDPQPRSLWPRLLTVAPRVCGPPQATGKSVFTQSELKALSITELREDSYIRVGTGSGSNAEYYQPQTPIACLLESYGAMCAQKDENSMLPLHYAAKNNASESVIKRLLDAYPKAAQIKSFAQRLPIHWGAEGRLSPGGLKLLVEAYPAGVLIEDAFGYLPKELAAHSVQSLLQ